MDAGPEYKAANEGEAMLESKAKLPSILRLPWPKDGSLHPYAHQKYLEFLSEVLKVVPGIYLITQDDLRLFLSDNEYSRLEACEDEIRGWLQKCSTDDEVAMRVYPYHSPFSAMWDLKKLLKKVAERRLLRARRLAGLKEISLPFDDANKYLNKKEYELFINGLAGAADAYLDGGKGCLLNDWRFDSRAGDYVGWTSIIAKRKKKEAREKQADLEYTQYMKEVNDAIKSLKSELAKAKKPKFSYPKWLAGCYPDLWFDLNLPTMEKIEDWAKPKIEQLVPQVLRKFLRYDLDWQVQALPEGKYKECGGVPCLSWYFFILVLISARLTLPGGTTAVEFEGYRYKIKLNAVDLGDLYLGPVMGGTVTGGTTPVALMSMLEKGELEGPGIKVIEHSSPFTLFDIQGFEDEIVVLHDSFRKFIFDIAQEQPLVDALLAKSLIDEDTAKLMKEKSKLPLPQLVGAGAGTEKTTDGEVVAALEAMGYKKGEIKGGMEAAHLPPEMPLEEKVKVALKNIGA